MNRNSGLTALILLMLVAVGASAQDLRGPLILPVADGGFVVFKNGVSSTNLKQVTSPAPAATLQSYAFVGQDRLIHRILEDGAGQPVFGYDLWISSSRLTKEFRIVVKPLDSRFATEFRTRNVDSRGAARFETISTVPGASEQQTLTDGDALSLDLLVNHSTGEKIVDVVKVAFDRSSLEANELRPPRDFTLEALELSVSNHRLLINGKLAAAGKSSNITSGALLWFSVQDQGRFIFSLVPRAGYEFQKIGVVEGDRIEFTFNGDRYEWLSSVPIVGVRGRWNLWVLADPKYNPLFAAKPAIEENSIWEKIERRITFDRNKGVGISTPPNRQSNKKSSEDASRPRVMIGGADRMENIWPKDP